ncbi:CBS domain protein [Natrialba magadii ATCC 43099]|uniref:CBS domain protein n=1 Tax=Natrialba magadii (strain ATCC 43099 / DSM 3394 / CCM 3739 / CIP 104546 / IAM 13178 / JCM 8861 / NBRC 102185 / NCIMB 2190 / MS3) TaxID=547559 RepID=D3SZ93_NATMM|nr:CBS domain-containing protein [Natrialba magadii]ADD04227.1 CBS domain protein [Natrialba magadii ATCC 43099]ELY26630.1 signal transduction protein with CBS domains [Natrialba magadii ATCC 43099]
MPIESLARSDVVTAHEDESVQELATRMDESHVGSVVITDGDEPIGIVTDRDLATRVLGDGMDPAETTASDVMSDNITTVDQTAGFYEATELMSEHGIRRLPVCDDSNELVGIITADDLNELLADEHLQLSDVIQAQRPEY